MKTPLRLLPLRLWALVLAGLLAVTSNFLFTGEYFSRNRTVENNVWHPRQTVAAVCLLGSVALAALGFSSKSSYTNQPANVDGSNSPFPSSFPRLWTFLPCLALYAAALTVYLKTGETVWVRTLWAGSVGALFVPLWRRCNGAGLWPIPIWEYSLIALITLTAFGLRYYDLNQLAYQFDNDVGIMGQFSQKLVSENSWRMIGMAITEHHFSEHQFLALSLRLFGPGEYGLVMLNVIAGTLSVPLIYLLGKLMFNRTVGLIAASFLCIDYVHLHFSRTAFGPIATFFLLLSAVCFFYGFRRANPLAFAAAGAAGGMAMLDYYSGRVSPAIYACLFLIWWRQRKSSPAIPLSYWLVALGAALLVFGPNLAYGWRTPSVLNGRGSQVMLWTDAAWRHVSNQYGAGSGIFHIMAEQIKRTLLAPYAFSDRSTICFLDRPMLGVLPGICFALGLGFFLRHLRCLSGNYLLLWIGLTFLCGGILTTNPPFWPHLNIAMPALALLGAVGLERFARILAEIHVRFAPVIVSVLLVGVVSATGFQNWNTYAPFVRRYAFSQSVAARHLQTLDENAGVFLVSRAMRWNQAAFQFLLPKTEGKNLLEQDPQQYLPTISRPTAFLIFPDADQKWITRLLADYPNATRQAFRDGFNQPAFTAIHVLPPGVAEMPRVALPESPSLWSTLGGHFVLLLMAAGALLGVSLLKRGTADQRPAYEPIFLPDTTEDFPQPKSNGFGSRLA